VSECPACGKTIKTGQKFCISCGAKLTIQSGTVYTSGARIRLLIPDTEIVNIKQLIEKEETKIIIRSIKNLFKKYSYDDNLRKQIYDIIGEILIENPKFFMKELYKSVQYKAMKFLSPQQKQEMEKYILRKFCFFKEEQFLTSSLGSLSIGVYAIYGGSFYVTNRRIIAQGFINRMRSKGVGGGPLSLVMLIHDIYRLSSAISQSWKKKLKNKVDKTKPCFGFEIPLVGVHRIDRKKKMIKFATKFEYEHKGETKIKTAKLVAIPLKEKGETKGDFQKRRETVLSKFNDVLNSKIEEM